MGNSNSTVNEVGTEIEKGVKSDAQDELKEEVLDELEDKYSNDEKEEKLSESNESDEVSSDEENLGADRHCPNEPSNPFAAQGEGYAEALADLTDLGSPLKSNFSKVVIDQENMGGVNCSGCGEKFEQGAKVSRTRCDHLFHDDCVAADRDIKTTCEHCREVLQPFHNQDALVDVPDNKKSDPEYNSGDEQ